MCRARSGQALHAADAAACARAQRSRTPSHPVRSAKAYHLRPPRSVIVPARYPHIVWSGRRPTLSPAPWCEPLLLWLLSRTSLLRTEGCSLEPETKARSARHAATPNRVQHPPPVKGPLRRLPYVPFFPTFLPPLPHQAADVDVMKKRRKDSSDHTVRTQGCNTLYFVGSSLAIYSKIHEGSQFAPFIQFVSLVITKKVLIGVNIKDQGCVGGCEIKSSDLATKKSGHDPSVLATPGGWGCGG